MSSCSQPLRATNRSSTSTGGEPATLDPVKVGDESSNIINGNLCENLLVVAPDFSAQPDGLFNWPHYDNPEVTQALDEARSDVDSAASARAFVRAQAMYAPAKLQITLAQQYSTLYLDNDLTGATVSFAYINSPWALHLGGK